MLQILTFTNDTGGRSRGLRATFVLTRTVVHSTQGVGLPAGIEAEPPELNAHGTDVRWAPAIDPGATVTLTVEVEGEPLCVLQVIWRSEASLDFPAVPLPAGAAVLASVASIRELVGPAVERHLTRCELGEHLFAGEMLKYHRFFCEYDYNTNIKLINLLHLPHEEGDSRLTTIREMTGVLEERVMNRWKAASTGQGPPPNLRSSDEPEIRRVSDLQLALFRKHFPGSVEGIDIGSFWGAFEAFSNGELRVQAHKHGWNGEPDSAHLFFFAEFAFMAIDAKADPAAWLALARPLVAVQRIFARAYRPPVSRARFRDYMSSNLAPGEPGKVGKPVSGKFKDKLRAAFGNLTKGQLEAAAGWHALKAFPSGPP